MWEDMGSQALQLQAFCRLVVSRGQSQLAVMRRVSVLGLGDTSPGLMSWSSDAVLMCADVFRHGTFLRLPCLCWLSCRSKRHRKVTQLDNKLTEVGA